MTLLSTDPLDILLVAGADGNYDIDLSSGDVQMVSGVAGVAQLCRTTLAMFRGEWFMDATVGIPYYENDDVIPPVTASQALFEQKFDQNKATRTFSRELLQVPGVAEVTLMEVTFDNKSRTLSVNFEVRTVFGDTTSDLVKIGAQGT